VKTVSTGAFHVSAGYRRYALGLLLLVSVLNYADRYLLGILIPQIKGELGLSDTQIGFISGAAFTILYAACGVPIARLADRVSRRRIIAGALVLWSAMTCLCGMAQSFLQLAAYRVLVGIGEAGCTPPSHSLISDFYRREERTSALAVYGLGSSFGLLTAFLLGGWITESFGWRTALVAFGAPGLLVAIVLYFTLREPPRGHADNSVSPLPSAAPWSGLWSVFRELWGKGTFRHMVLGGSMYGLCMIALLTWIPSFFQRTHGLEMGVIGTWLAFTKAVPHAAGTLLAGFLADRLARRGLRGPIFLCVFAQLVATPFYSVVLLWPDPTGAFLWLVIPSMVGVMQGPVLYATIQAVARVETRAVAAAIMILIINLASGVLGPLLVGLASDLSTASFGADALGYALLGVATTFGFLSALHFYLASRAIEHDLGPGNAAAAGAPARA
jgi:MFS family permease